MRKPTAKSDSALRDLFDFSVKGGKAPIFDRSSRPRQKFQVVREVVQRSEPRTEAVAAPNQVTQVAPTVVSASRTNAIRIDRCVVALESRVS